MGQKFVDYFQILEIHILAGDEAVRAAYKRLSALHHPDNGGEQKQFLLVQEAYEALGNPKNRKDYFDRWKQHYLSLNQYCEYPFGKSIYDLAFQALRETVHEYMHHIMNHHYEDAYQLLSSHNKNKLFKKDFVRWQQLIGEIHELIAFDSTVDSIENLELFHGKKTDSYEAVTFKIRIREYNHLLNRVEADYFTRTLICEEGQWKILLSDLNIKGVIKKYKKIVLMKKKAVKNPRISHSEWDFTRNLSSDSFIHNLEYEFLRYERYHREFGLMLINKEDGQAANWDKVLDRCTRKTDSYCHYGKTGLLILFPETSEEAMAKVKHKMADVLLEEGARLQKIGSIVVSPEIKSAKELLNQVVDME